ncbi:MAG: hypothetical protein DRR08_27825 [Candidatus Parabeggiatoa sp. nov. 2]|nr:MAG: hypothetical protein B6247_25780 [Beggiatoa sp. 4572_84]RKZ52903.1 MAG: hypothetical protein DRR08_27825 [Gammaproteobacteria bacterium]HEC84170.1 hypothetical protein [Thioploca sp.]
MSQLQSHFQDYIQALESLQAQYSENQALLDAAEDKWGTEDVRYLILQQRRLGSERFDKPNPEATPEEPIEEEASNELIDWLPDCIDALRSLSAQAADDQALLAAADQKWGPQSYGYQVIEAGGHQ